MSEGVSEGGVQMSCKGIEAMNVCVCGYSFGR